MKHEIITAAPEGIFERVERRLGRSGWTIADYAAEGAREWDRCGYVEGSNPFAPSCKADYVSAYVRLNCPPAKLKAFLSQPNKAEAA